MNDMSFELLILSFKFSPKGGVRIVD